MVAIQAKLTLALLYPTAEAVAVLQPLYEAQRSVPQV